MQYDNIFMNFIIQRGDYNGRIRGRYNIKKS